MPHLRVNGDRPASLERNRTHTSPTITRYYERDENLGVWAAIDKTSGSRRVMVNCGPKLEPTFHAPWDGPDPIDGHAQGEVLYALNRAEWIASFDAS